jgi:membrane-bound lytic murein transglycosylase F
VGTERRLWIVALAAVMAGCTPSSENAVRKADDDIRIVEGMHGTTVVPAPLLDARTRRIIRVYGKSIQETARRYGFDWRLVLAVMKQESRFAHEAKSPAGARGFMQIMPVTGEEVRKTLEVDDIHQPMANVEAGVYYLSRLHRYFEGVPEPDRTKLALASYNAGISRVYDAQEVAAYVSDNPSSWQSVKDALPLLSRRYATLHASVWGQDRPRSGYFGGSRQTIAYVERVMTYYDEYRLMLN